MYRLEIVDGPCPVTVAVSTATLINPGRGGWSSWMVESVRPADAGLRNFQPHTMEARGWRPTVGEAARAFVALKCRQVSHLSRCRPDESEHAVRHHVSAVKAAEPFLTEASDAT